MTSYAFYASYVKYAGFRLTYFQISKSLYCINKIKNFVNQTSLKQIYFAMIHSCIVYCLNIFDPALLDLEVAIAKKVVYFPRNE